MALAIHYTAQLTRWSTGAKIIRTPTEAPHHSEESNVGLAKKLLREIPNSVMLDQYNNPASPFSHAARSRMLELKSCDADPDAHYFGTGAEIVEDLAEPSTSASSQKCDVFVGGAGTGGTISGISRRLREANADVLIIGVDPRGSILARPESLNELREGENDMYRVEGIGYDFIPGVLKHEAVDHWEKTDDEMSFAAAKRIMRTEGILCGGSAGSALAGALNYLKSEEGYRAYGSVPGKNVVLLFADSCVTISLPVRAVRAVRADQRSEQAEKLHHVELAF